MAESNIAELKAQFDRMQREINTTLELLKKLDGETVIVEMCPESCAPLKIVNPPEPPRLDSRCEKRIERIAGPITVQDTEDAIEMLDRWTENMIAVLADADKNLLLP